MGRVGHPLIAVVAVVRPDADVRRGEQDRPGRGYGRERKTDSAGSQWIGTTAGLWTTRGETAQPLMLHTGNVRATVSPMPSSSDTRTTSSTSL